MNESKVKVGQKWKLGEYANEVFDNIAGEIIEVTQLTPEDGYFIVEATFVNPKEDMPDKWFDGSDENFAEENTLVEDVSNDNI